MRRKNYCRKAHGRTPRRRTNWKICFERAYRKRLCVGVLKSSHFNGRREEDATCGGTEGSAEQSIENYSVKLRTEKTIPKKRTQRAPTKDNLEKNNAKKIKEVLARDRTSKTSARTMHWKKTSQIVPGKPLRNSARNRRLWKVVPKSLVKEHFENAPEKELTWKAAARKRFENFLAKELMAMAPAK